MSANAFGVEVTDDHRVRAQRIREALDQALVDFDALLRDLGADPDDGFGGNALVQAGEDVAIDLVRYLDDEAYA